MYKTIFTSGKEFASTLEDRYIYIYIYPVSLGDYQEPIFPEIRISYYKDTYLQYHVYLLLFTNLKKVKLGVYLRHYYVGFFET